MGIHPFSDMLKCPSERLLDAAEATIRQFSADIRKTIGGLP